MGEKGRFGLIWWFIFKDLGGYDEVLERYGCMGEAGRV
jgi:hypothetical protein